MESVRHLTGFTLAELLIALSILGLIATFTIPKVLVAQQDMTYRANAKDVAAAISAAYDRLRLEGQLSPDTKINDLTPFLNYVSVYTGIMDDTYTDTNINCSNAVFACLKLHNGGTIAYRKDAAFGGTATTNALPIHFDPDGRSRMEQPTVPEKASLSSCTITSPRPGWNIEYGCHLRRSAQQSSSLV